MTLRQSTSLLMAALTLSTILLPALKANGQQDQTIEGATVKPEMAAARVSGRVAPAGNPNPLPDAPSAAPKQDGNSGSPRANAEGETGSAKATETGKQTKRILYIIPNFRAVSADQKLPPQSVKEKFRTTALDSMDYSSFIFVGVQAGIAQARNGTPEFRQGAAGYGRYYWHTYVDYADENLWVEFIFPALLHQDSRYYTLGRGGFAKRFGYSFSRVVITRTDSGHQAFNASEVFGSGVASGISNLYYPSQERTFSKTYQLWLTNLAIDGGTFVFKEFWPDINGKFFHQKD